MATTAIALRARSCDMRRVLRAGFSVVLQDVVIGPVLRDYVAMIESRPLCVVTLAPRPRHRAPREKRRAPTRILVGVRHDRGARPGASTRHPKARDVAGYVRQTPDETVEAIVAPRGTKHAFLRPTGERPRPDRLRVPGFIATLRRVLVMVSSRGRAARALRLRVRRVSPPLRFVARRTRSPTLRGQSSRPQRAAPAAAK